MTNQPKQKTPLTTETQTINREKCSCGVPHDVHGTCCGWNNASAYLNELGIIIDSEHPFFQKTINEWINGHNTISLTAETEHKHGQSIPGTRLVKMEMEICECGHEAPIDYIVYDKNSCGTCMPCHIEYMKDIIKKHQQKTSLTKFKKEIAEHLGISYKVGLAHFINAINKIKKTKT